MEVHLDEIWCGDGAAGFLSWQIWNTLLLIAGRRTSFLACNAADILVP